MLNNNIIPSQRCTLFLLFLFVGIQFINAQDADLLLQKMDNLIAAPKDKQAAVKMVLTDKSKNKKIREAVLMQKGMFKKMYRYTKPEKKKGIATLSLPDGIMWLYMPSFERPMKISLLSKSQAFNGTDFSHEDMNGISFSDRYIPALVDSDIEDAYLLELTPKIKKLNYSKVLVYLDKTHNYPVKIKYYNKSGKYAKVATYKFIKQDSYWFAQEVLMTDVKKNHSTGIIMSNVKFDQGLKDEEFTVEKLMQ